MLFAFVVLGLVFFSTEPRDWLGRTSPKWPILCWVWRKNLMSINPIYCHTSCCLEQPC